MVFRRTSGPDIATVLEKLLFAPPFLEFTMTTHFQIAPVNCLQKDFRLRKNSRMACTFSILSENCQTYGLL